MPITEGTDVLATMGDVPAGGGPENTNVLRPGALRETFDRSSATITQQPPTGKMWGTIIKLMAGDVISAIEFFSSGAFTSPTNQWFGLADASSNILRLTNDDTTNPWLANSAKKLTLTAPYSVPTSDNYYLIGMIAASGMAQLSSSPQSSLNTSLAPIAAWIDDTHTGLTTPASAPATATPGNRTGISLGRWWGSVF